MNFGGLDKFLGKIFNAFSISDPFKDVEFNSPSLSTEGLIERTEHAISRGLTKRSDLSQGYHQNLRG